MELFAILSFLAFLIPLATIVGIVKLLSTAIFNQQKAKKDGTLTTYQQFMKELNQEKERLRTIPDKKENVNQKVTQVEQKTVSRAQYRNNVSQPARNHSPQKQSSKTTHERIAELNRESIRATHAIDSLSFSETAIPTKNFVQSKKQVAKRKKQTPRQKEILSGIVYKEILDKPRALRPYR